MEWIRGHQKVAVGLALGAFVVALLAMNCAPVFITIVALTVAIMLIETCRFVYRKYMERGSLTGLTWLLVAAMVALILFGGWGLVTSLTAPRGNLHTLIIILVVVATDTAAQIIGRRFGTPGTFFKSLSPNKTKVGAIAGGIAGVVVAAVGAMVWYVLDESIDWRVLAILVVSVPLSMAGDLLESALKRMLGIKDFGHLLGRSTGGFMDRLDSWLPVFALGLVLL